MLLRLVRRQRSLATPVAQPDLCRVCTCSCGRNVAYDGRRTAPIRAYASAPAKRTRPNPYLTVAGGAKKAKSQTTDEQACRELVDFMRNDGFFDAEESASLLSFILEFADMVGTRKRHGPFTLDQRMLVNLTTKHGLKQTRHARDLARVLIFNFRPESRLLGQKLMYGLAASGDALATIYSIENAFYEAQKRPQILNSAELLPVRQRLTAMANGEARFSLPPQQLFLLQTCEGRVAKAVGNVDYAIQMWTAALTQAAETSALDVDLKSLGGHATIQANASPWLELFLAFNERHDSAKARWAAEFGCRLDDPMAHYYASLLAERRPHGQRLPTSEWLFHTIKAAGAGHAKAAHNLGIYYASSEWKYLEDEPPDEIKPTPFDTYPPDSAVEQGQSSWASSARRLIGSLFQPESTAVESDHRNGMFLTAAFPPTPHERWKMALEWLETSMGLMYAPSFLLAAHLYLQDTHSLRSAVPANALQLKSSRYTYASPADFLAGRKMPLHGRVPAEDDTVPNPGYNPEKAKELIREVFHAVRASAYRRARLGLLNMKSSIIQGLDAEDMTDEVRMGTTPTNLRKWFRYMESMESYNDDDKGTLMDDFLKADLEVEATAICDERKWDIYDDEGGLMYRHGLGKKVNVPRYSRLLRLL